MLLRTLVVVLVAVCPFLPIRRRALHAQPSDSQRGRERRLVCPLIFNDIFLRALIALRDHKDAPAIVNGA